MESYEALQSELMLARSFSDGVVVLDIDSSGGVVDGLVETVALIRLLRAKAFVVSYCRRAASAAYVLASAAHRVYAAPSAGVGGLGVVIVHRDESALYESLGVKHSLIVSEGSKRKVLGNPFEPLSDSAREMFQVEANRLSRRIEGLVKEFRPDLKDGWQSGDVFDSERALELGMIDKIVFPFDLEKEILLDFDYYLSRL